MGTFRNGFSKYPTSPAYHVNDQWKAAISLVQEARGKLSTIALTQELGVNQIDEKC